MSTATIQKYYLGDTIGKILYFYDETDALVDPNTIVILIIGADGVTEDTLSISDLTSTATGIYRLKWNIPSDSETGMWKIQVTATITVGSVQNTEVFTFVVEEE